MRRRVWLARHASTDWTGRRWCGTIDLPLNDAGRAEAESLALALGARVPPGTPLVSSPLRRALETAERLAPAIASTVSIDASLREVDFGDVEGLDWTAVEALDPSVAQAIASGATAIDWPGGESILEVRARAAALWHDVASGAGDVVIVSHGAFIRAVLGEAVHAESAAPLLRPAAAIELAGRDGTWSVVA
jgi:broad specificity phosphatase PhoE